jgi:hypothetical protein
MIQEVFVVKYTQLVMLLFSVDLSTVFEKEAEFERRNPYLQRLQIRCDAGCIT